MAEGFSFNDKQRAEIRSNSPQIPESAIPEIEEAIKVYKILKKRGESEPLNKKEMIEQLNRSISGTEKLLDTIKETVPVLSLVYQLAHGQAKAEVHPFTDQLKPAMASVIGSALWSLPAYRDLCAGAIKHIEGFPHLYKKTKLTEGLRILLAYSIRKVLSKHGVKCTSSPGRPFVEMLHICFGAVDDNLERNGRVLQDLAARARYYAEWEDRIRNRDPKS